MKYWVAYNDTKRPDEIVAFHEDREVVQNYIDSVIDITYKLGRCKSSELKKIRDVKDLYLVKHLDTYVQCKYYEFIGSITEEEVSDLKYTIGVLERTLRLETPGSSTKKSIVKTIAYLKGLVLESEGSIPDYETMQREYNEIEFQREKMLWGDVMDNEDTNRYLIKDSSN